MRRKQLNTVFDESVNPIAESILEIVQQNLHEHKKNYTVNRSTILRIAMNYGLHALYSEMGAMDLKGQCVGGKIKIEELRAMLGSDGKKASD